MPPLSPLRQHSSFPSPSSTSTPTASSLLPFHEAAQSPPILLKTALHPAHPSDSSYPLTLYIARVIGSNNVILSNFKPGHNSVTRLDVESSLYFIQNLDPQVPLFESSPTAVPASTTTTAINTDPPSPSPSSPISDSPTAPPLADHPMFRRTPSNTGPYSSPAMTPPAYGSIRRKPLANDLAAHRASILSTMEKPLDPPYEPPSEDAPAVSPYLQGILDSTAKRKAAEGRPLPLLTTTPAPSSALAPLPTPSPRPPSSIYSHPTLPIPALPTPQHSGLFINTNIIGTVTAPEPLGTSLKLIRWHHSSGRTWPVARIVSAPLPVKQHIRRKSLATIPTPVPPMRVIMENPGYALFADTSSAVFSQRSAAGFPMLVRDVEMAYEKSWTKKLLQHSQKKSEGYVPGFTEVDRSARSVASVDEEVNLRGGPGVRKEGYTFLTPWGTRCYFRTGMGGGSLVCYHVVNVSGGGGVVSGYGHGHHARQGSEERRKREIVVSELRFNLPGRSLFSDKDKEKDWEAERERESRRNSFFGIAEGMAGDGEDNVCWLGKEKAGGGRHGDNAKMGKLIIYEGGREMVDLVVAANMGIWWRTWEVAR